MKIPSLFYGKPGQVSARVRKLARGLVERNDFTGFDPGPLVELDEGPAQILACEVPPLNSEQHFHCYMLHEAIADASPQADVWRNMNAWLMGALDEEWRFMCTLNGSCWLGFKERPPPCARKYVEAAVRHWPAMNAHRSHFAHSSIIGDILDCWSTLYSALEILGLSSRERMKDHGSSDPLELVQLLNERVRVPVPIP